MKDSDQMPSTKEESSLNQQNQQVQQHEEFDMCPVSDSDCDYFDVSIKKETEFPFIKSEKSSLFKRARLDVITWILDETKLFGFHHTTAYLALVYYDRFFAGQTIAHDGVLPDVEVISVACLSLAVKMEESVYVELSDYHVDGYNFESKLIQEMEFVVLYALEWRMVCVTPFDYLRYFVTKLFGNVGHDEVETIVSRADELIMAVMVKINAAEQRPSVVAAAAVLASYDHQLTKTALEVKMSVVPSWGSLEKEHLFSCYKLMQGIIVKSKSKTTKSVIPTNSSSTTQNDSVVPTTDPPNDLIVLESQGAVGAKRRQEFGDDDLHCPQPKIRK